jgi:hypothetical protein
LATAGSAAARTCPPTQASEPIVTAPPPIYPAFYQKYIDANGIAILGDAETCDRSLQIGYLIITHMLSMRPDIQQTLAAKRAHVGIYSGHNVLSTPDFAHARMPQDRPQPPCGMATGPGAKNVANVICEANVIGFDEHYNRHASELIHEFGHVIMNHGVDRATFEAINLAYRHAFEHHLFPRNRGQKVSYAMTNSAEFFAEATTAWFSAADWSSDVNSDAEKNRHTQARHDPEIDAILRQIYPDDDWKFPRQ